MSQRLYLPGHPTPAIGGAVQPGFAAGGPGGAGGGGGDPNVFTGAIYFDSTSQPYGQPVNDGGPDPGSVNANTNWVGLPLAGALNWAGPQGGEPAKANLTATNGYTPNEYGDRCFQWKLANPDQNDKYEGGFGFIGANVLGKYFDKTNGFRAAVCARKLDNNATYDMHYIDIFSHGSGYATAAGVKRPNDRLAIHINGRGQTPDRFYGYEYIGDGATTVASSGPITATGTNWDQDHTDWCIIGIEVPAGMSGAIKGYMSVPGVTGPATVNVHTLVGDWSAITLDGVGWHMWRRNAQNAHNQIAWMWVGALTDDWPA